MCTRRIPLYPSHLSPCTSSPEARPCFCRGHPLHPTCAPAVCTRLDCPPTGTLCHYWAKPPAPVWTPSSARLGFTSYTRPTRLSLLSPLPHLQPSLALLITLSFCLWGIFGSFPECWSVPSFKVFGLHIKIYLDPWEPKEIRERVVVNKNKNTEVGASVWAYLGTSCPSFNFMKQSIFTFSVYLNVVS